MNFVRLLENEQFRQLILIIYGVLLGTLGNLLYRVTNKLKTTPIVVRVLWGLFSLAVYVAIYLYWTKTTPTVNIVIMLIILIIGYYIELLVDIMEKKISSIIDRLIDKYLGGNSNENEKKE